MKCRPIVISARACTKCRPITGKPNYCGHPTSPPKRNVQVIAHRRDAHPHLSLSHVVLAGRIPRHTHLAPWLMPRKYPFSPHTGLRPKSLKISCTAIFVPVHHHRMIHPFPRKHPDRFQTTTRSTANWLGNDSAPAGAGKGTAARVHCSAFTGSERRNLLNSAPKSPYSECLWAAHSLPQPHLLCTDFERPAPGHFNTVHTEQFPSLWMDKTGTTTGVDQNLAYRRVAKLQDKSRQDW